jgi:hypothetical protein
VFRLERRIGIVADAIRRFEATEICQLTDQLRSQGLSARPKCLIPQSRVFFEDTQIRQFIEHFRAQAFSAHPNCLKSQSCIFSCHGFTFLYYWPSSARVTRARDVLHNTTRKKKPTWLHTFKYATTSAYY